MQILEPYSFYGCHSLNKVIIPQSVILLYGDSFGNCPNLTEMYSFSPKIYSWQDWKNIFKPDVFIYDNGSPIASNQVNATLYVQNEYISNYEGYSIWQGWGNILPMVPLTEINILDSLALNVGQSQTMDMTILPSNASVPNCKWKSSDPSIASVDYNGVITAHKAGTATITATGMYYPEISSSCSVTVTAALPEGDVNGDGKVDVIDINAIVNVILDNTSADNKNGLTDVNGDGKTDVIDINALINIILGQ